MATIQFGGPLRDTAEGIRSMQIRGAAAIGQEAARALAEEVARYGDEEGLWDHALAAARSLAETRPTAVSLRNALNEVLRALHDGREERIDAARAAAQGVARRVEEAQAALARHALPIIEERPRVLTHCHSTAVVGALSHARREGIDVTAVVTETRPWRQGLLTARALREADVPVRFVVDGAMGWMLRSGTVDQVLVGADAVMLDGTLYNKIGTRLAALAARDAGLPMRSLAEHYKFSPYEATDVEERNTAEVDPEGDLPPDVEVVNPVFDETPAEFLAGFVTDDGVLEAADVGHYIERHHGGKRRWI